MKLLTHSRLSRRALLRNAGAGLALAPFVPLLTERHAQAQPTPKRLLFFYSNNGTVREKWLPTMSGGDVVLSEILQPLESLKKDLLVIDGLGYNVPGWTGHHLAVPLTGAKRRILDAKENWLSEGISVDQRVADVIGTTTKFRSIEAGIQVEDFAAWVSALSYRGPAQPMRPESSPYKIFDRLFTGLVPPAAGGQMSAADQARLDRKSVLDFVTGDLKALRPKLSADEQKKIDAHGETLRDIERTLNTGKGSAATASCKIPVKAATALDVWKNDNIPMLGRLQVDLLVMGLACDLVRVGTVQHGRGGAQHRFTWLGAEFQNDPAFVKGVDETSGIHSLAHAESKPTARALLARCHQWYAGEVKYLVDKLRSVPEGNGTMGDNTLVVWMNEQGTGNHSLKNTPWVIVGGMGHFKTGRVLQFPGQPHNQLLLNICHAFGVQDKVFGEPEFCPGPLPGLTI